MPINEVIPNQFALGVDVGSTTVKCVLTKNGEIIYQVGNLDEIGRQLEFDVYGQD